MFVSVLPLLLLIAFSENFSGLNKAESELEGEFVCPNAETDFYPADPFCTGFYYTCEITADSKECPGTPGVTAFDPVTKTCEPIECAFCYFTCPASSGFFAVPGTWYYISYKIKTNERRPINTIFVNTESQLMFTPLFKGQQFTCPSSDGVFAYPEVCSTFYYLCTGGQSSIQYCPGGSIFDPETLNCVLNENASCSPGPVTTTTTSTPTITPTTTPTTTLTITPTITPTTSIPPDFICPTSNEIALTSNTMCRHTFLGDDGLYAFPGQCVKTYYACVNGIAYPESCSEGDVFDPVTFTCTPSELASCNQKIDCLSDGLFPYPDACSNLYFVCSAGESYVEYCPENLVFDPLVLMCVVKENASCTNN
uniref:Chitin-binding type-2 domain-containing protein n=1 Tax=Daphnia galeata TaxID=27404 RepID=A0A8J2RT00_9CRUS|nr:unnamed protein product [Daphnia galeata]